MRVLGRLGLCAAFGGLSACPPAAALARSKEPPLMRSNLERDGERVAVGRALAGALRRLERPACQRVFRDFRDGSGRSLQEGLDAIGQDGAGFLRDWVYLADGRQQPRCAERGVLAVTHPGSRAVWICGQRFVWEQRRDPGHAEVVLIHEALHALGLGEDPPTSAAITRQVVARCQ